MILSQKDRQIIYYSIMGPCILSFTGCSFILLMFLRFKALRNTSFKMIVILSLLDLLNSISFLIPTYSSSDHSSQCLIQAMLLNFSTLGSIIWTTLMAFLLYFALKKSKKLEIKTIYKCFFCLMAFCVVCTVVPLVVQGNTYGRTQGWCWIQDRFVEIRDCLLFGPVLVLIPVNFVVYLKIRAKISRDLIGVENEEVKTKMKNKMLFYPLIIVLCYLPYTVKAILELFFPKIGEFEFTLIAGIVRNFHGFLNFLIYGLNNSVQRKVKDYLNYKIYNESLISDISDISQISMKTPTKGNY